MKHHDDPPTPEELAALETEFQVLFEQTCEPPSNGVIERLSHHAERVVDANAPRTSGLNRFALAALVLFTLGGVSLFIDDPGEHARRVASTRPDASTERVDIQASASTRRGPVDETIEEASDWSDGDWPIEEGSFSDALDLLTLPPEGDLADEELDALEAAVESLGIDA